ncbi:MAG: single-stranded DNA-binding protein [Clostridia bacterium]|nr:single-stranded DNA-binding protein [Clostridia bacterium]
MMNVVTLMGRLTADPELRTTTSGLSVCRFTVAVDRNYAKAGTERQADFINCVAWRQTAEFVSRYFVKGQLIALDGSIQTGSYTDNNGNKRYTTEVVANNVHFTGDRRDGGNRGQSSYSGSNGGYSSNSSSGGYDSAPRQDSAPAPTYSNGSANDFQELPLDDDLPF